MAKLPFTPPGLVEEGAATKAGRGRPRNKPPICSILNRIKGIEELVVETGEADFSLARKLVAAYSVISLERAYMDEDIPLKIKADWSLRIGPVIAMLDTMIPKDTKGYPKTEVAVDKEIEDRQKNLLKLLKGGDVSTDKLLQTMAPAAQAPPEEA